MAYDGPVSTTVAALDVEEPEDFEDEELELFVDVEVVFEEEALPELTFPAAFFSPLSSLGVIGSPRLEVFLLVAN